MFTLYRSTTNAGGFRAVAGEHHPLNAAEFSRHQFESPRDAYAACKTDAEREVVLLVAPEASSAGTWVRVDKSDGEESTVTREQVLEALQVEFPAVDATALRKAVMKAEAGRTLTSREKVTKFARFEFHVRGS